MKTPWYILLFWLFTVRGQNGLFINGIDASLMVASGTTLSVNGTFSNIDCDPVSKVRVSGVMYCTGGIVNHDSLVWLPIQSGANEASLIINDFNTDTFLVGGTARIEFWSITIERSLAPVLLKQDIVVRDTLRFNTGHLFLNNHSLSLKEPQGLPPVMHHPWIKGERQVAGLRTLNLSDTGKVVYSGIAVVSNSIGLGNIGLKVKGPVNVGDPITVTRRHQLQYLAGKSSIALFFDVSGNAITHQDTLLINYSTNHISNLPSGLITPSLLGIFVAPGQDLWWHALPLLSGSQRVGTSTATGTLVAAIHTMTTPLAQISPTLFRVTIADPSCTSLPPGFVSADTLHICQGKDYTLQAGTTSPVPNTPLRYEWRMPNAVYASSCIATPTVSFQKIILKSVDVRGCSNHDSCVIAPTAPLPQFIYFNHLNACLGDSLVCKDSVIISSGNYTNTFLTSDNQSGVVQGTTLKIKFPVAGTYTIQLKSTSNYGCEAIATRTNLQVYSLPLANSNYSLNCVNHQIQLNSTSLPGHTSLQLTSHHWKLFNTTYQGSVVAIAVPAAGQYTFALRVQDNAGCADSLISNFIVPSQNTLSTNVYNRCEGDTTLLQFNGTCAYAPCKIKWRPGDGTLDSGSSVSRVYQLAGQKLAKLYVLGQQGCTDSLQQVITVNSQPSVMLTGVTGICSGLPLNLIALAAVPQGTILSYLWNGVQGSPVQSFTALPGNYTQSLMVVSDSGCVKRSVHAYTVWPRPVAAFQAQPVCLQDSVYFVHTGTIAQQLYQWQYGNAMISPWLSNPQHAFAYTTAGNYSVQEIVQNSFGCRDSIASMVQVFNLPQVNLGGTVTTCGTQYSIQAGNANLSYTWWPLPAHSNSLIVLQSGWVGVTVANSNGCHAVDSAYIQLNTVYHPGLGVDRSSCGPLLLYPNAPAQTYSWSTGASSASLIIVNSGTYALTAIDQNGCVGWDTVQVNIEQPASIQLPRDTSLCFEKVGLLIHAVANTSVVTWQDGFVGATRSILRSGDYIATAALSNGCTARDTLHVSFKTTPGLMLSNSYSACTAFIIHSGITDATFDWSDGTHLPWIQANASTNYSVIATTPSTGCVDKHTFSVGIYSPSPINLGNDTLLCSNTGYWLSTGNFSDNIVWMDGVSLPDRYVTLPGVYSATVTNSYGCWLSDAMIVQTRRAPDLETGPELQYLCGSNALSIQANAVCDWSFNDQYFTQSAHLSIVQPGVYVASYTENGCTTRRTVEVIQTNDSLMADFLVATRDTVHQPVQFVCLTNPLPLAVEWDFGDGQHSTELHPIHEYVLPSDYTVALTVWNEKCEVSQNKSLKALFRRALLDYQAKQLAVVWCQLYPVPASSVCFVDLELSQHADISIQIFDWTGRVVLSQQVFNNHRCHEQLAISTLQKGGYACMIRVQNTNGCIILNKRLIIE